EEMQSPIQVIEKQCNDIAAEFLLPTAIIQEKWDASLQVADNIKNITEVVHVSSLTVAIKAFKTGLIDRVSFLNFYNKEVSEFTKRKKIQGTQGGPSFHRTIKTKISKNFMNFIYYAVKSESLSYRDAYHLTTLYGNNFEKYYEDLK
ncbi:MAG: hypothetical protein QM520_00145, partial [Gammaproteobacteria bacterium]|nr:hypothetical protein [Gammaproteobacteria bacterium]